MNESKAYNSILPSKQATKKMEQSFNVMVANISHVGYAYEICEEMAASAKARGTGIARRTPQYLQEKMVEGKAVIALDAQGVWAGFCYIESWSNDAYVANSGLIVSPLFRKSGLARQIKHKIFELSRKRYPSARIFGLTTGLAVMKINSELGYEPVTYSELTDDDAFWSSCRSCVNYDILTSKGRKNCLCTAMLYDPKDHKQPIQEAVVPEKKAKNYERLIHATGAYFSKTLPILGARLKSLIL